MYVHTHTNAQGDIFRFFLCRQGGRDAVRWKATVTDEKSLASFLSLSLSLSTFLLSLFLPSSSSLHFHAFSLLPLLPVPLIRSLLRASLCFIFSLSLSLFGPSIYFFPPSSLCFTLKEEIGTLSCNPSVVTLMPTPMPCSVLPLFFPHFCSFSIPATPQPSPPHTLTHTRTHTHTHTQVLLSLMSSQQVA